MISAHKAHLQVDLECYATDETRGLEESVARSFVCSFNAAHCFDSNFGTYFSFY